MDDLTEQPTPLEFLTAVYCNENFPLSVRMRAAIEAAQYKHPRLAVMATVSSGDFAEALDRAIQRSQVRLIRHQSHLLAEAQTLALCLIADFDGASTKV
jgi:hypothetical protein